MTAVSQAVPESAELFLDRRVHDRFGVITDDESPDDVIDAISARWNTEVVDSDQFDPFDPTTAQVRDGRLLVGIGTPEVVRAGLISVPVSVVDASLGGSGTEYLFAFDIDGWHPVTPEEAGVEVVSWMS